MKIREVITEDVDMSWWKEIDARYNPEALKVINKQEDRAELLKRDDGSTPIFTKPVRSPAKKFSNTPPEDEPKSSGYVGNVEVRTRAKHISTDDARKLTNLDLPRSPRLPG